MYEINQIGLFHTLQGPFPERIALNPYRPPDLIEQAVMPPA